MPGFELLIYGAGGFAREVAWLAQKCSASNPIIVRGLIDDSDFISGKRLNGIPVLRFDQALQYHSKAKVVVAIGVPKVRAEVVKRVEEAGFHCTTLIHPSVETSEWVEIGEGSIICAGSILTTNIQIGRHVQVNLDCTIGHDSIVGDFTTLAPGVHVSGSVHIGKGVYVGTGAVIINGTGEFPIRIGDGAVVGAGACVTRSVESSTTVVGVPARTLVHVDR